LRRGRRVEISVLAALGLIAACLFAVIALLFAYDVADRRGLLASAAVLQTPSGPSRPTPVELIPSPTPTWTPTPVAVPRPTNTLVIPKELVNDRLIQDIELKMVALRNLPLLQPVPKRFLTKEDLRQLLAAWYAQDNPAEETLARQQLYVELGFIREEDDLDAIQSDLMARNMAGLYSALDKNLYIVSERWNMTAAEEMTLSHELTHALQDQHYNLLSLDERARTLDAHLAVLSLIEGDATLSMSFYAVGNLSQHDVDEMISRAAQFKPDQLLNVPPAITRMTLFPYEAGLRFVQTLYGQTRDWRLVNTAYGVPPLSTEQILHVEKYLTEPDVPLPVALPALDDVMGGSWKEVTRGVLGEFLMGLHLEPELSRAEASQSVAGWGGDSYSLLTDHLGRRLLVLRSVWDTRADAQEFFNAYATKMERIPVTQQILLQQGKGYWRLPNREVYLGVNEQNALVIIAPDRIALDRALYWFPGY